MNNVYMVFVQLNYINTYLNMHRFGLCSTELNIKISALISVQLNKSSFFIRKSLDGLI